MPRGHAAHSAKTSTGTASLKLDSDPLGSRKHPSGFRTAVSRGSRRYSPQPVVFCRRGGVRTDAPGTFGRSTCAASVAGVDSL
jgi:hypothetical protein